MADRDTAGADQDHDSQHSSNQSYVAHASALAALRAQDMQPLVYETGWSGLSEDAHYRDVSRARNEHSDSPYAPSFGSYTTVASISSACTEDADLLPQRLLVAGEIGVLQLPRGPNLRCPYLALACECEFEDLHDWDTHCRAHFSGHLPVSAPCPLEDCHWVASKATGQEAWDDRLRHVEQHPLLERVVAPIILDNATIDHMWRHRVLSDVAWKQLRRHGTLVSNQPFLEKAESGSHRTAMSMSAIELCRLGESQRSQTTYRDTEFAMSNAVPLLSCPTNWHPVKPLEGGFPPVMPDRDPISSSRSTADHSMSASLSVSRSQWSVRIGSDVDYIRRHSRKQPPKVVVHRGTSEDWTPCPRSSEVEYAHRFGTCIVGSSTVRQGVNSSGREERVRTSSEAAVVERHRSDSGRQRRHLISPLRVSGSALRTAIVSQEVPIHTPHPVEFDEHRDRAEDGVVSESSAKCSSNSTSVAIPPQKSRGDTMASGNPDLSLDRLQLEARDLQRRIGMLVGIADSLGIRNEQSVPRHHEAIAGAEYEAPGPTRTSTMAEGWRRHGGPRGRRKSMVSTSLRPMTPTDWLRSFSVPLTHSSGICFPTGCIQDLAGDETSSRTAVMPGQGGQQKRKDADERYNRDWRHGNRDNDESDKDFAGSKRQRSSPGRDGIGAGKRLQCIFRMGSPERFGHHRTEYDFISRLLKHLKSHRFFACAECLVKFDNEKTLEAHKHDKACQDKACRRHLPRDRQLVGVCDCVRSSQRQWRGLYHLQFPERGLRQLLENDEDPLPKLAEEISRVDPLKELDHLFATDLDNAASNGDMCFDGSPTILDPDWNMDNGMTIARAGLSPTWLETDTVFPRPQIEAAKEPQSYRDLATMSNIPIQNPSNPAAFVTDCTTVSERHQRQSEVEASPKAELQLQVQSLQQQVIALEHRLSEQVTLQASRAEPLQQQRVLQPQAIHVQFVESVLNVVWERFQASGSEEARPGGALAEQVELARSLAKLAVSPPLR